MKMMPIHEKNKYFIIVLVMKRNCEENNNCTRHYYDTIAFTIRDIIKKRHNVLFLVRIKFNLA